MIDYHKEKCTFRKRDRLEEFFVENSLVESLHKVVVGCLQELGYDESEGLQIMNEAYELCHMLLEKKSNLKEVHKHIDNEYFENPNDAPLEGLALCVTRCLVRAHQELMPVDAKLPNLLKSNVGDNINQAPFDKWIEENAPLFKKKIEFGGTFVKVATCKAKAFCIESICNYACKQSEQDAKVIINMIRALALENNLKNQDVSSYIEKINHCQEMKKQPSLTSIVNNNHNSQVFNGEISKSTFKS